MSFDNEGFLSEEASKFHAQNRERYSSLFSLVENVNRYAHRIKFSFDIHNGDLQEVICSCLFLRILNSYAASVRLAEAGMCHDGEAICRVALEALFYLKSCAEDRGATIAYVKSDQQDRLKLVNVAKDKSSSLHELVKTGEFTEIDALHELLKKEIEEDKIAERKAWEAASKAKLSAVYDYAYRLLSQSVHTSPRSISRYVKMDEAGEVSEVYSAPEKDSIPLVLFTASSTLIMSLMVMRDLFKVEMPELEELGERFQKLDKEFAEGGPQ